jgi:hypothetical protein
MYQRGVILSEFDETLWHAVVHKVTVYDEDEVQFIFGDGTMVNV